MTRPSLTLTLNPTLTLTLTLTPTLGEARAFEAAGQRFLFDDSFEHEVWNEGGEPRHVLGIELVHPGEHELKDEV